jgi:hypothetical protein
MRTAWAKQSLRTAWAKQSLRVSGLQTTGFQAVTRLWPATATALGVARTLPLACR